MLAGAAGSIGGSYGPPYIALDGGYYNNAPRPSSQISSSAPVRFVFLFCYYYVTLIFIVVFCHVHGIA